MAYSTRCPECGYGPIGPFSDNCPICAAPVRGGDAAPNPLKHIPPAILVGVLVIGFLSYLVMRGNWAWVLLMAAPAGVAWWALVRADSKPPARALGGIYLGLLLVGYWVATRHELLPGLRGSPQPPYEMMMEIITHISHGGDPMSFDTVRRLKTWIKCMFVVYPLVIVPPLLLIPPLLRGRRRHELIRLPRRSCYLGLSLWAVLLAVLGFAALPRQLDRLTTPQAPTLFDPRAFEAGAEE
jgi:hypothetical protein